MSTIAVLLGLLVVAYVGGQLIGRSESAYRLPSGGEYLLLGLALGPHGLGAVERSTVATFAPLAAVGTAWLSLVIGADYGFHGRRRASVRGVVFGLLLAVLSTAAVAAAVFFAARALRLFEGRELLLVSAGAGILGSDTTRHAVRWVLRRHAADGPLSRLVSDVAEIDDLVPILGVAFLVTFLEPAVVSITLPPWAWLFATLGIGFVLGATASALLRAEPRASDGWGVIIGAVLLSVGLAWRLGLAPLSATFVLGATLSALSRHGSELRAMLRRSEHAVLLPVLLLAGATVVLDRPIVIVGLLAAALLARLLTRLALALALLGSAGSRPGLAPALAGGLMPSGALCVALGLLLREHLPGPAGNGLLALSVGLSLVGEVVGPVSLRRALEGAGETSRAEPARPSLTRTPSLETPP